MSESTTLANALTSDQRWARWVEQGVRRDERVGRNMRIIAAMALMTGSIAAVLLLA